MTGLVSYPSARQGMTLLEVLLATFILATVIAMVTMALSGSVEVVNATRDQGEVFYRAQVTLQRISEDLASALLTEDSDFIGQGESPGAGEPILSFTSTAHVVFDPENDHPGNARISYRVVPDKENATELLLLRSDERLPIPEGGGENGYLLCDRLRSIRFSYTDQAGEESDSWSTEAEGLSTAVRELPVVVTCTLELWLDSEQDSSIEFSTSVLIPVGLIRAEQGKANGS